MNRLLFATLILLALLAVPVHAETPGPLLINAVTVSRTHIVFALAGDLWRVARAGGAAERLTATPDDDGFPVFSPDGSQIAFSRLVGGSWDLFLVPASGGEPKRLTHHPEDDLAQNWTPDGRRILFTTTRDEESVFRLYTIATDGVLAEPLPLPYAFQGVFSPDGTQILYTPKRVFGEWRHYRGGSNSVLWLARLSDGELTRIPATDANDSWPMWVRDSLFFVSDRSGTHNLYTCDRAELKPRQLTKFERYGIRSASACEDAIAFVRDGRIHLYDPVTNADTIVNVSVAQDPGESAPRPANAATSIDWVTLTHAGDKVVSCARGDVFTLDPATGKATNLTATPGVAERYPATSPDGTRIAYFSDVSGEYELHVRPIAAEGPVARIKVERQPSFYRELTWSPDGRRIAFTDKRLALWSADVDKGTATRIDTSTYFYQQEWFPVWSPDGRWLVYSKHLPNRVRTVFIHDTRDGKTRQLTDGITHAESPAFDATGRYLYFLSSLNAGTSEFGWGVLNGVLSRPLVVRRVHALILSRTGEAPVSFNREPNPNAWLPDTGGATDIDFDGIERRFIDLPLPAGDYGRVLTGKPGRLYLVQEKWGSTPGDFNAGSSTAVSLVDLTVKCEPQLLVDGVGGVELSGDGGRLLFSKGRDWFVGGSDTAIGTDATKVEFKELRVQTDPRAEWRQMYHESWRLMRDWFYDPNHHGQDLTALEAHYAEYLPGITRRADLNTLVRMALGHVSVSHFNVGGGDVAPPATPPSRVGLLGADYEIANNRFRFARVLRSIPYSGANGSFRAPLDAPGVAVREGEYLLAVDGTNVDTSRDVDSYFEGKAGRPVKLTVGPDPAGANSRTMTVVPTPGENRLRTAHWAERNRQYVEQRSKGTLGYIFIEDYGAGIQNGIRGLVGYSDRAGVVVDQRFNGGGITPDWLVEWFRREPLYYYTFRNGADAPTPVNPGPRARVLLINEHNGSAAETGAFMWKLGRVGTLVGQRTYGAGIGPSVYTPLLLDGGRVQLPNRAAYNPDGSSWGIENVGVAPDVPIEVTPKDFMAGRDPQLERAIEIALAEAAKASRKAPRRPPYPIHPE